jgi:anti-sigma factor RsiW
LLDADGTGLAAGGAAAYDAGMGRAGHPTQHELEGLAFGLLGADEMRAVGAHARDCPACRARVERDVRLRRRLRLLRADQPPVDVVPEVLRRTAARDGRTATGDDACV